MSSSLLSSAFVREESPPGAGRGACDGLAAGRSRLTGDRSRQIDDRAILELEGELRVGGEPGVRNGVGRTDYTVYVGRGQDRHPALRPVAVLQKQLRRL